MVLSALPGAVQAQAAFTATTVNVRAGPGRDYPLVAVLPAGLQVAVQGCLTDYSWCDVVAGPNRGWVYAGNLNYVYQNTYVPLLNYGPVIGIGVLGFVLDDYWGRHYHDRPWYPERHRWATTGPLPPPRAPAADADPSAPPPPRSFAPGPRSGPGCAACGRRPAQPTPTAATPAVQPHGRGSRAPLGPSHSGRRPPGARAPGRPRRRPARAEGAAPGASRRRRVRPASSRSAQLPGAEPHTPEGGCSRARTVKSRALPARGASPPR